MAKENLYLASKPRYEILDGLLKVYDEPVREWLKEHWLKRK